MLLAPFALEEARGSETIDVAVRAETLPRTFSQRIDGRIHAAVGVGATWRLAEVFGIDVVGVWSPDLERHDWKAPEPPNNRVSIDVSEVRLAATGRFVFTPISGELQLGASAPTDVAAYVALGFGVVATVDDLAALQIEEDPGAIRTERQVLPTTSFAAGVKVTVGARAFVGAEVGRMQFVEVIGGTQTVAKREFVAAVLVGRSGGRRREPSVEAPSP